MGWLALKWPQANLYMSSQGLADMSIELRSRPGRGFSGAGCAGAEGCCARQRGEISARAASARNASGRHAIQLRVRSGLESVGALSADDGLMQFLREG